MNTIPNTGKWNEISSALNNNFNLIATKLLQLDSAAWKCLGIYPTLQDANNAHPAAENGTYVYVGSYNSYDLHVKRDGEWVLTESGLKLSEITQALDLTKIPDASLDERGLMTIAQVKKLADLETLIEAESTARESGDQTLIESFNKQITLALSSNPYFSHIETAQVTVSLNSVSPTANYTVVYLSANGRFAAYYGQTYYASWQAKGRYSAPECYGPFPIIGKVYVDGSSLYAWDGSELMEIGSIRQLLEFEAQVVQSDKGVFFTEENGIEARLGKGLMLDDNNAIAIDGNGVVTPDDNAPKLTAGFADNLVGRGEATPETISFRQTAGNTSIEDGTARIVKIRGNTEVVGENLISTNISAIKTVGLNSWDEKWTINPAQGSVYSNVYVPVISGKKYFFSSTREGIDSFYASVRLFDKNKQKIGEVQNGIYFNTSKNNTNYNNPYTIPADVAYIAFNISPSYGAEYKNDICIHLEHTGYKNGTYEPYKEFIRPIPIADIKDSNGAQLFPEGLCSIGGNVYDEITPTKAIKRVGVVDLGDLTWITSGTSGGSSQPLMLSQNFTGAVFPETANVKANILCAKYQTYTATQVYNQNVGVGLGGETDFPHLYLYDPNFTDAATFKSAMRGVKMYFQLAEPIEVKFDEPLNLDYQVWDFGTESVVSDGATAPLKADIIYQFNAVDRIRENSRALNFLSKLEVAFGTNNIDVIVSKLATLK